MIRERPRQLTDLYIPPGVNNSGSKTASTVGAKCYRKSHGCL
jgi:hypothetical protein